MGVTRSSTRRRTSTTRRSWPTRHGRSYCQVRVCTTRRLRELCRQLVRFEGAVGRDRGRHGPREGIAVIIVWRRSGYGTIAVTQERLSGHR